jgi:choline dehydrogenase-like flavoprotein
MRNTIGGSVTLASANPFDAPNIDPALLNSDFDIFAIREGVKAALRFAAAPAWKDYVIGPYGTLAEAKTDAQIEAYARSNAATVYHPFSTASMSPNGSSQGVVNPDLRVKNTVGLRIVDASVVVSFVGFPLIAYHLIWLVLFRKPYVPAAHPQAVLYAIAERAAILIVTD